MREIEQRIAAAIGTDEVLLQLAEEASELSKAALKLRRARTGTNPTPIGTEEATANLIEEIADVYCAIDVLSVAIDPHKDDRAFILEDQKMQRWVERLKGESEIDSKGMVTARVED